MTNETVLTMAYMLERMCTLFGHGLQQHCNTLGTLKW